MLLAQYWRSFQNCAIFDCECGAVLDDLRHDERREGEKLMNSQRSDVLVLRMLVRPVKMNPGPALDRPLPAKSGHSTLQLRDVVGPERARGQNETSYTKSGWFSY